MISAWISSVAWAKNPFMWALEKRDDRETDAP